MSGQDARRQATAHPNLGAAPTGRKPTIHHSPSLQQKFFNFPPPEVHFPRRRTAQPGLPSEVHASPRCMRATRGRRPAERRPTFRGTAPHSRHRSPPPRDPAHLSGPSRGPWPTEVRAPGPRLPGTSAAPAPARQLSGAPDGPGRAGPGGLRPFPGVAGRLAGFASEQGRGGRQRAEPPGTSPLHRGTPGATARPAPALGFRLPPGRLNLGGRKSRPRVASGGRAARGGAGVAVPAGGGNGLPAAPPAPASVVVCICSPPSRRAPGARRDWARRRVSLGGGARLTPPALASGSLRSLATRPT